MITYSNITFICHKFYSSKNSNLLRYSKKDEPLNVAYERIPRNIAFLFITSFGGEKRITPVPTVRVRASNTLLHLCPRSRPQKLSTVKDVQ